MPGTAHNVLTLGLPTPWPVGDVNVHLVDGPEPILVDTGVRSSRSLKVLNDKLEAHGRRLAEIRHILCTHGHYDHAGAARRLSQESGATLYLHERTVLDPRRETGTIDAMRAFLLRCGMPRDLLDLMVEAFSHEVRFADLISAPRAVRPLSGGETVDCGGVVLEVIATPGHSPDHLCYHHVDSGALFCGDMLLPQITPNPLLYFDPDDGFRRYHSLIDYLGSLDRLESRPFSAGYPGHGDAIGDLAASIARSRAFIDARSDLYRAAIARGVAIPYELSGAIFGELGLADRYLAVSETIAHLDLLERGGAIAVDWEADPIRCTVR